MNLKRKCQVVMLSTNKKANIQLIFGKLDWGYKGIDSYLESNYQHLYILSDEEIKEGDWCIETNMKSPDYNKPFIAHNKEHYLHSVRACNNYQSIEKIIASIDKSLNLPEPSPAFIQKYIEEWNKDNKITEIMVDYWCGEQNCNCTTREQDCFRAKQNLIPKVDKNNQITITKVKDSWNREEIINAIHKVELKHNKNYSKLWEEIEENL